MVNMNKVFLGLVGFQIHAIQVDAGPLEAALSGLGFRVYLLDGLRAKDNDSFFDELARALDVYVGHSWDSFGDVLTDRTLWPERRIALIWKNADRTFAADAQVFVDAVCNFERLALELGMCTPERPEAVQMEVFLLGGAPGFKVRPRLQPA